MRRHLTESLIVEFNDQNVDARMNPVDSLLFHQCVRRKAGKRTFLDKRRKLSSQHPTETILLQEGRD
jgi:hypothetical protein